MVSLVVGHRRPGADDRADEKNPAVAGFFDCPDALGSDLILHQGTRQRVGSKHINSLVEGIGQRLNGVSLSLRPIQQFRNGIGFNFGHSCHLKLF